MLNLTQSILLLGEKVESKIPIVGITSSIASVHASTASLHTVGIFEGIVGDAIHGIENSVTKIEQSLVLFLSKPLEERLKIARALRETSREAGAMKSEEIMDVTPAAVSELFDHSGASVIIHGHTHRPKRHRHDKGERIVLGDWGATGWYLVSDSQRLELNEFSPA